MKLKDVLDLKHGDIVDFVEGKVRGVFTKRPTPSQQKHGIHQQDVVLEDEEGHSLRVIIMNQVMHIPDDSKGRVFKFESVGDDRGAAGLKCDIWDNVTRVQADSRAAIMAMDKLVSREESSSKPAERREAKPLPPERESRTVGIDDHIGTLVEIIKKMDENLNTMTFAGGDDYGDLLTRLSTTVYIQAAKEGLVRQRKGSQPFVPVVVQAAAEDCRERKEPVKVCPLTTTSKLVPEKMHAARVSEEYIVNKAFAGELKSGEVKIIDELGGYNWETIFDKFQEKLVTEGHIAEDIGNVYDDLKAGYMQRTKKFSNADFCKFLMCDAQSFMDELGKDTPPEDDNLDMSAPDPTIVGMGEEGADIPF